MAEAVVGTSTSTLTQPAENQQSTSPAVRLKLKKPKNDKKVQWKDGTVDNEFMNKKKSKCCCIYEKPKLFGESSDESDSDDDGCSPHCQGHKKKCYINDQGQGGTDPGPDAVSS